MRRYTVILEYRGGTYVDQIVADSRAVAICSWMKRFENLKLLGNWTQEFVCAFEKNLGEFGLIELSGIVGVWYFDFNFRKHKAWGHVVVGGVVD